jgi:hypothetical protein
MAENTVIKKRLQSKVFVNIEVLLRTVYIRTAKH